MSLIEKPLIDRTITITMKLNDLGLYLAPNESLYPKTDGFCDLIVHKIPNWLLNFGGEINLHLEIFNSRQ